MTDNACQHINKAYANFSYATSPPKTPWICKDCGKQGIERGVDFSNEYESIKKKFETS